MKSLQKSRSNFNTPIHAPKTKKALACGQQPPKTQTNSSDVGLHGTAVSSSVSASLNGLRQLRGSMPDPSDDARDRAA
jgi:hypothetical protein